MNKVLLVAVRKMRDLNATSQKLKHEKLTHDVAFQSWLYSKAGQGSLSGQEEVNNAHVVTNTLVIIILSGPDPECRGVGGLRPSPRLSRPRVRQTPGQQTQGGVQITSGTR